MTINMLVPNVSILAPLWKLLCTPTAPAEMGDGGQQRCNHTSKQGEVRCKCPRTDTS